MTMQIGLLFPPPGSLESVIYLALPTLAAYLRRQGISVVQHDVNRLLCEQLLTKPALRKAQAELRKVLDRIRRERSTPPGLLDMAISEAISNHVIDKIDEAIAAFREQPDENQQRFDWARSMVYHAARMLTLPYHPSMWTYDAFQFNGKITDDLKEALDCAHSDAHVFVRPFREKIVPDLLAGGVRVFGICLAFIDQVIPALTLARVLREQAPEVRIVVGGPIMPYLEKGVAACPELFDLIDFIIVGEGEEPLTELMKQIHGAADFERVPSLTYRAVSGEIRRTPKARPLPAVESPAPEFDGNTPEKYWTDAPYLPYLSARGCYYGRCEFCSINSTYGSGARVKPIPMVIEELAQLQAQHNASSILFADEAIGPARMREFSEALLAAGLSLRWFALARMEKGFTPETLQLAYRAGCRVISWGLESGSQRLLNLMNKGTRTTVAQRVLRDSARAGIWNHVFMFFGYPGETEADVDETVRFATETADAIHSLVYGTFRLERCSPLFDHPERHGILLHEYPGSYIRPDLEYSENGESGFDKAYRHALRAKQVFDGLAPNHVRHNLHVLVSLLGRDPQARKKIRAFQTAYAEQLLQAREILADSRAWEFALDGRILWLEMPFLNLTVAFDQDSGKAIAIEAPVARTMRSPEGFQRLVAEATSKPHAANSNSAGTLAVALHVLPIRARRRPVEPVAGGGQAVGAAVGHDIPEGAVVRRLPELQAEVHSN